jgi:hypothetical protein
VRDIRGPGIVALSANKRFIVSQVLADEHNLKSFPCFLTVKARHVYCCLKNFVLVYSGHRVENAFPFGVSLMKRFLHVLACLTLAALSCHAQTRGESLPRLTNKEILEMTKAGLSSHVIIAKIKVSRCTFDTEPTQLVELRTKGVANEVLQAMIEAPYGNPQAMPNPTQPNRGETIRTPATNEKASTARVPKTGSDKPSASLDSLEDFDSAKFFGGASKTHWELTFHHQHVEYPAKTARHLSADLAKPNSFKGREELRAYQSHLNGLTDRIGLLGGSLTYFLYGTDDPLPFRLVRFKDTKCFVAYVSSSNLYNTVRLSTVNQRAARAASSYALPTLRELAKTFHDTDIETLAIFVTYGTKDFLSRSALATKAEVLGIVLSKRDVQAFANNELSDKEVVKKAVVLVSDRDESFDFIKVELELD